MSPDKEGSIGQSTQHEVQNPAHRSLLKVVAGAGIISMAGSVAGFIEMGDRADAVNKKYPESSYAVISRAVITVNNLVKKECTRVVKPEDAKKVAEAQAILDQHEITYQKRAREFKKYDENLPLDVPLGLLVFLGAAAGIIATPLSIWKLKERKQQNT